MSNIKTQKDAVTTAAEIQNKALVSNGFSSADLSEINAASTALKKKPFEGVKDFQALFKNPDGTINFEKVRVYSQKTGAFNMVDSMEPVIHRLQDNTDKIDLQDRANRLVKSLFDAGVPLEEALNVVNKLSKVINALTPHPTEHLSKNGIDLIEELFEAAELPRSSRFKKISAVLKKIDSSADFFASKKSTIKDEMDLSNQRALICILGANEWDRALEQAFLAYYDAEVDICTNTAPRSWDYDADGKPNAEGLAMIAKLATSTLGMYQALYSYLGSIKAEGIDPETFEKISDLKEKMGFLIRQLTPLHDEARQIIDELAMTADPEKREALYKKHYPRLRELTGDLENLYSVVGDRKTLGLHFYEQSLTALDDIRKKLPADTDDHFFADEAFRTLKKCGFALEKGQTRHNDGDDNDIIDALFANQAFREKMDLSDDVIGLLNESSFSVLKPEIQDMLLSTLTDKIYEMRIKIRKEMRRTDGKHESLLDDPFIKLAYESLGDLEFSQGSGYPDQARTILDRLVIRSLMRFKFEEGVISDATRGAATRQNFLAAITNQPQMKHMPLFEDPESLSNTAELNAIFAKHGGQSNIQARVERIPAFLGTGSKALHIMFPASDSEKVSGPFARMRMFYQIKDLVRYALENNMPLHIQLGGGHSFSRHGSDVTFIRKIVAQEMNEARKERGYAFDPDPEKDEQLIRMSLTVMHTTQGRSKRIYYATPDQVANDLGDKYNDMIEDYLELTGRNSPQTPKIDDMPSLDDATETAAQEAMQSATKTYEKFRNAQSSFSNDLIVDRFANLVRCPHLMPFMNNGARPLSKKKAAKEGQEIENPVSDKRAIENDESWYLAQSFHHGFFSSGQFMEEMIGKMKDPQSGVNKNGIRDLVKDPRWAFTTIEHNMVDAARFNATHLFDRVSSKGIEEWSFDRAIAIGKSVNLENNKMTWDGADITEEEAYLCKIYYDRMLFIATTEAALNTNKQSGPHLDMGLDEMIQAIRPTDNSLEVMPGPKTLEEFPVITEVLEEHRKNMDHFAIMYMINDYIEEQIQAGRSKSDIIKNDFGNGDYAAGEAYLRNICAAYRAGTIPHKLYWTGKRAYGQENRLKHGADYPDPANDYLSQPADFKAEVA